MGNIKNGGERFVEALFTRPLDLSCCVRCSRADAWRRSRAVLLEEGPALFPGDGAVAVLIELTEHHGPHGVGAFSSHAFGVGDTSGLGACDGELLELFKDEDTVVVLIVLTVEGFAFLLVVGVGHTSVNSVLGHSVL